MLYCIRVFLGEGSNYILIHLILTSERMPTKFFNNTILKRIIILKEVKVERLKQVLTFILTCRLIEYISLACLW